MESDMQTVTPVGWVLIVRPDKVEEKTRGGLYVPQTALERQQAQAIIGTVLSIGDEAWNKFDDKSYRPSVGDRVLFAKYGGQSLELDGDEVRILNDQDILGVVDITE
jgi:chaperonin GroES